MLVEPQLAKSAKRLLKQAKVDDRATTYNTSAEVDYDYDHEEALRLDYFFRKGDVQEATLREYVELFAELRVVNGFGPSRIREYVIDEARLLTEKPILKKSTKRRQSKAKSADIRRAVDTSTV